MGVDVPECPGLRVCVWACVWPIFSMLCVRVIPKNPLKQKKDETKPNIGAVEIFCRNVFPSSIL